MAGRRVSSQAAACTSSISVTPRGNPAAGPCSCSSCRQKAWKVPTVSASTAAGTLPRSRSRISVAARFEKVSARMLSGGVPRASSTRTRSISVRVLPVPGPASTSTGPRATSAATRCDSSSATAGGAGTSGAAAGAGGAGGGPSSAAASACSIAVSDTP